MLAVWHARHPGTRVHNATGSPSFSHYRHVKPASAPYCHGHVLFVPHSLQASAAEWLKLRRLQYIRIYISLSLSILLMRLAHTW